MTWQVQLAADKVPAWVPHAASPGPIITHLGHPVGAEPECTVPGIYEGQVIALAHPLQFPVEAAQAYAGAAPRWRLVCTGRRKLLPGLVLGAMVCFDDPPMWETASITCTACRRWAHVTRRHHHRRPAPAVTAGK